MNAVPCDDEIAGNRQAVFVVLKMQHGFAVSVLEADRTMSCHDRVRTRTLE